MPDPPRRLHPASAGCFIALGAVLVPAKAHELERLLPWAWKVERLAAGLRA